MKRLQLILPALIISLITYAQTPETIIVGDVYDAYTGEPLSNVNIYFQGTSIGTTSNPDGMFLLRGEIDRARTMVVSAVGYYSERFRIEAGQQVAADIALKEKISSLGDVFVTPGSNPALPLMENVRKHRQINERILELDQINSQTALYVSDIQSRHLRRNLWKNLQASMIQQEDSTYFIPLYWRKQEATKVEEKATLLTLTDYQILLNQLQATCNFYHNNINILSATLLSPLANSGNTYYNYYLVDSIQVDNEKHYIVHFRTKNAFYATFDGEMTIDSASYALRSIHATVPSQSNINYLRQMSIHQTFSTNNMLEHENMSLLLDFAIKADTNRIFPTLFLTRSTEVPTTLSSNQSPITIPSDPIFQAMDSINNTQLFRHICW